MATRAEAGASSRSDAPYACFVSAATPAGAPFRYRYARPALHFPGQALAPGGATTPYRYHAFAGGEDEPVYVANCVIPATRQAVEIMNRRFGVRDPVLGPDGSGVMGETCVTDGPCRIDGLDVKACQYGGEFPYCKEKPQPEESRELLPCLPADPSCGGGVGGGGDVACTTCDPSSALLYCSASVRRGEHVSCTISASGTVEAGEWRWVAGPGAPVSDTVRGPTGSMDWGGVAVAGGKVSVPVHEGDTTRTLEAVFQVAARGWKWATHAVSEYTDGQGPPCFDHTPGPGIPNARNLQIGVSDCRIARRMIQPDSYDDPADGYEDSGDGFTVATVASGPNQGLHYVVSASLRLRRTSTYNTGLLPNARRETLKDTPLYPQRSQCGEWANWYEFNACMNTDPDHQITGIHAHEGHGMNGGYGHYSAAYEAAADPAVDPMIFFDNEIFSSSIPLDTFASRVRRLFQQRAAVVDERTLHVDQGGRVGGNWTGRYCMWFSWEGRYHCQQSEV